MDLQLFRVPLLLTIIAFCGCSSGKKLEAKNGTVEFENHTADKRVDVKVDGKLFTSYTWPDSVMKPVLFPIINAAGTEITRGYPVKPRPGERADHPHHVGMWLNYGNVNGLDFWGNSFAIPEESRKKNGGTIKHIRVGQLSGGNGKGTMTAFSSWQDPSGKEVFAEKTEFNFLAVGSTRIIDRITTLTATGGPVNMKDTKEGMFAIRVARQLELPSEEELVLTDASNNPTTVSKMANEGVTGNYKSSEGITGDSVWGTKAKWMNLYGNIGNEQVSLVICDHPENPGYPTYWHARGYGLFSANPFGVHDFTNGKESMNFSVGAGKTVTLKYRVIISSGKHLTNQEINDFANDFAKKY